MLLFKICLIHAFAFHAAVAQFQSSFKACLLKDLKPSGYHMPLDHSILIVF